MIIEPKEYFVNFERVSAIQYDGTNGAAVKALSGLPCSVTVHLDSLGLCSALSTEWSYVEVGQWLVKHSSGAVTVQDVEPPYVEEYLWAVGQTSGEGHMWIGGEKTARHMLSESTTGLESLFRQPIIRTGPGPLKRWFAPWEPTE